VARAASAAVVRHVNATVLGSGASPSALAEPAPQFVQCDSNLLDEFGTLGFRCVFDRQLTPDVVADTPSLGEGDHAPH
jgi:hypothetical protein